MLRIEHLSKQYGSADRKAVDDLSLHIQPGEIYGFIGHNGAGKTTTLKSCAGILNFDAGDIFVDGISIRQNPLECKRRMAYIPDNPDLYEFLSGVQYLNFVADVYKVSAADREQRIARYADALELTDDLAGKINSSFVGLDPKAAHTVKLLMRQFCDNGGAIFFSTHVLEVAEKLCDKVAIIRGGKLVTCGDTETVRGNESLEDVFLELVEDANA